MVKYVEVYLNKADLLRRKKTGFLIGFKKPHNKVSRETIRRWVKAGLELSGVDTSTFTPHSTRVAPTDCHQNTSENNFEDSWPGAKEYFCDILQ